MKITKVLNGFCKAGQHDKCPAVSKGNRTDRETFVCLCDCHKLIKGNPCGFCQGPCKGSHYISSSTEGY
jgi:hypothetical protein